MEFAGNVAVITAGAGGIGRACARALAAEEMSVVIADIDGAGAQALAEEINERGSALAVRCDVTDDDAVAELVQRTLTQFGRVDLLHNHAGIAVAGALDAIPLSEWERVLQFNVLSGIRGLRAFLPHLLETHGHVVNTTSSLGVVGGHPIGPMVMPYIASKRAIVGLTQCLADWLRPQGVGVSLLAPDHTATGFDASIPFFGVAVSQGQEGAEAIEDNVPYGIQQPDEIARIYVDGLRENRFLLSSTPDIETKLRTEASGLLDPDALRGVYA